MTETIRIHGFRRKSNKGNKIVYVPAYTRKKHDYPQPRRFNTIFGKHIQVQKGALHGWQASMPAKQRQTILVRIVLREGYHTALRRLNFLKNISRTPRVDRAANEDAAFLRKYFKGK